MILKKDVNEAETEMKIKGNCEYNVVLINIGINKEIKFAELICENKGKTLIYDGKLLSVYVDDYLRKNKDTFILSINSPTQKKKEIIYNAKDLLPSLKQSFSYEKHNFLKRNRYNGKNQVHSDKA